MRSKKGFSGKLEVEGRGGVVFFPRVRSSVRPSRRGTEPVFTYSAEACTDRARVFDIYSIILAGAGL
ncbi:hypothetical protein NL676_033307 [Syzygium grande]|nr:hypothetical protein NL676_033307 [Syzygium grande]